MFTMKSTLKDLINDVVNEKIDIPDNSIVISDINVLTQLFTKKRIELISLINKHHPDSIQDIADMTGRKKQAVHRDLKILEGTKIISLKKNGRNVMPIVKKEIISIPLIGICG